MKYCKDCKWCKLATEHTDLINQMKYARCTNPQAEYDPVSGEPAILFCSTHREFDSLDDYCGRIVAKWFEPKKATIVIPRADPVELAQAINEAIP